MRTSLLSGLQQSRTSGALVTIYSHGDDPVIRGARGKMDFLGRANAPDGDACVTAVSTSKTLGAAAGTFSVTIKAPTTSEAGRAGGFLDRVVDDDWVDIVFTINGRKYHVLRGLVENIRGLRATSGSGAQARTFTLTGRDFGCIFERTPIWFNIYKDALARTYALKLLESKGVAGPPDEAVRKLLYGFMEVLTGLGRVNWDLPKSMPNVAGDFPTQVVFISEDFDPEPTRVAASMQLMDPTGQNLWGLAQEWSDPMFCELYCDLQVPTYGIQGTDPEWDVNATEMRVIFRTRPHPSLKKGRSSLWYQLPMTEVPPQYVASRDIGRGGMERYNAFFVSPQVVQTLSRVDLTAPIWDLDSVTRHGLKPFYVESKYVAVENDLVTMTRYQRELVRDWHCMDPYLYNGSVDLAALFPGVRVGTRFRILGEQESQQETYYVEQVAHQWAPISGGKTSLGVTRGWVGTDGAYEQALATLAAKYTSAGNVTLDDAPAAGASAGFA